MQDEDVTSNDLVGDGVLNIGSAFASPGVQLTETVHLTKQGKNAGTLLVGVEFQPQGGNQYGQQGW